MTSNRELLDFAAQAAWDAGRRTLGFFQTDLRVDWKQDGSPVTAADRASEELLRRTIEARFPDHAIVGEEMGATERDSPYRWILDPLDGTRAFARGVPLYGVLVALELSGEVIVGVVHFPALGETYTAAAGEGSRWNGRPCRVSATERLDRALVAYTDAAMLRRHAAGVLELLERRTALQRGWSDCYAYALVASGRAEIALDALMNVWDCAALVPVVREAGGTFTDWSGGPSIRSGSAFATNGALFDQVLALIAEGRRSAEGGLGGPALEAPPDG
jgi:histidinol phosphatase-like enzyme (inositol monophosphatase family)